MDSGGMKLRDMMRERVNMEEKLLLKEAIKE